MNLVRWNPYNDMLTFRDRMNRFFDDPMSPIVRKIEDSSLCHWNPAVDVYEEEDNMVIKAELPGIDRENISVDLKDRTLTIKGERADEQEVKEEHFYRRERIHGRFERSFTLPADVGADKISADYKDGVLKVTVPKPEAHKPRQISIQ
jgi:HSP20 family protein